MAKDDKKFHNCPYCNAQHVTPGYVFAHWNDSFTVKCTAPGCGRTYTFFKGQTWIIGGKPKKPIKEKEPA